MESLKAPLELKVTGNMVTNWQKFHQQFSNYMKASGLELKEESVRIAIFLNLIGEQGYEIYDTLDLTKEERAKYDTIIKKFEAYCVPKTNILYERHCFYTRNQKDGENFDQYLTEVKKLAKSCNFKEQKDELVRDRIVFGMTNEDLRQKLIKEGEPDLQETITKCRIAERTTVITKDVQRNYSSEIMEVKGNFIKKNNVTNENTSNSCSFNNFNNRYRENNKTENCQKTSQPLFQPRKFKCRKCDQIHEVGKCPAYGYQCHKCKNFNHFAKSCKTRNIREVNVEENFGCDGFCENKVCQSEITINSNEYFIDTVYTVSSFSKNSSNSWNENFLIENKLVRLKLDTGSEVNILPLSLYNEIKCCKRIEKSNIQLRAYGGTKIVPYGSVLLKIKYQDREFSEKFVLVDFDATPLLGLSSCDKLGVL